MNSKVYFSELSDQPRIAQLQQLTCLTWDGDLISKSETKGLLESGLIYKVAGGWNIIGPNGINYLKNLGFINP